MASSELEQIRDIQKTINSLLVEQMNLQAKGEDLTDRKLDRLRALEEKETALLKIQERRVNAQYRGDKIAGQTTRVFSDQLRELSSISSLYGGLVNKQKDVVEGSREEIRSIISKSQASQEQVSIISNIVTKTNELNSIQQELAESDTSKLDLQNAIRDSYDANLADIEKDIAMALAKNEITAEQAEGLRSMLSSQQELLVQAEKYATISTEAKEQVASQIEAYREMKKAITGTLDTIRLTLQTPQAMIMAATVAAGKFASAMGEVNRETGMFIGSTAALSFVFDDATSTLKQMAKLSGDVNSATFGAQLHTNILAVSLGTSGENAATLVNAFGNLQGSTDDVGRNMVSTLGSTARLNGVLPNQIMEDMASATEEMALYSKGTGENFGMAAIQAAKLGVSIGTTSKMANNLLDFESSIEKELEASAMLGRDINLTKARELAYADDIVGATRETLAAVGGINEFNKMDVYQRNAVAEALGVSVAELKQMVANEQNLNTTTGKLEQSFGFINDTLRAIGDKFGGPIASGVTFFVGELIRARMTAAAMKGEGLGGILKSLNPFKSLGGPVSTATTTATTAATDGVTDISKQTETVSKGTKFNATNMIKGAAAILILAAALYVAAKAFQQFATVEWESVGKGLVGIAGLATIAYVLGKVQGDMIKGALAVAILGAALIPFAYAMSLIAGLDWGAVGAAAMGLVLFSAAVFGLGALMMSGVGAAVFGAGLVALVGLGAAMAVLGLGLTTAAAGFASISSSLPTIIDTIAQLSQIDLAPIFSLANALDNLAWSLIKVGAAGVLALPILNGVKDMGLMGSSEGGQNGETSGMIDELKALRNDLTSGKIAVYIDGRKVTNSVATTAGKDPTTVRR